MLPSVTKQISPFFWLMALTPTGNGVKTEGVRGCRVLGDLLDKTDHGNTETGIGMGVGKGRRTLLCLMNLLSLPCFSALFSVPMHFPL